MSVFKHVHLKNCLYLHLKKRISRLLLTHSCLMTMWISNKSKRSRFSLSPFGMIKRESWIRWTWLLFPALPLTTHVTGQSAQPIQSFRLLICRMEMTIYSVFTQGGAPCAFHLMNVCLTQGNRMVGLMS